MKWNNAPSLLLAYSIYKRTVRLIGVICLKDLILLQRTFIKVLVFWNQKSWVSWLKPEKNKIWSKKKFRRKLIPCLSIWWLNSMVLHAILSWLDNASWMWMPVLMRLLVASICLVAHFQKTLNKDTITSILVTFLKWC